MVGLIVAIVLVLIVALILITPVRLTIDTPTHDYRLNWGRLVDARLVPMQEDLMFRLQIAGIWKREQSVLQKIVGRKKRDEPKSRKKHTKKRDTRGSLRTALAILRSFNVRRWDVNIDTGDYATNAYLFPVAYMLSKWRGVWRVNYEGDVVIRVAVDNRPFRILRAWLRTKF